MLNANRPGVIPGDFFMVDSINFYMARQFREAELHLCFLLRSIE